MKTPESYLYQNQEKMLFFLASEGKRKKITKRDEGYLSITILRIFDPLNYLALSTLLIPLVCRT